MANEIDYVVDVLATSPTEISSIAARLKRPSPELVAWVAERFKADQNVTAKNLERLVAFEPVKNLSHVHDSANKAKRFENSFKRWTGIVDSHLLEVSEEFPSALFLLEHFDQMASYSGKMVILAGELLQEVYDGNQRAQAIDWTLLDIFAPFRAEYELGVPFGSLWAEWIQELALSVATLKSSHSSSCLYSKKSEDNMQK